MSYGGGTSEGTANMGPEEGIGSLDLGLQVVVSHLTWVLGIELQSSGRTVCHVLFFVVFFF